MDDVLIGRQHELAEVAELLKHDRLVAIVGPPGVGKTRLAYEVVADVGGDYDEVVTVELAALAAGDDPARTVAHALQLPELERRSHVDAVATAVSDRRVLLLFDNCEQLAHEVSALTTALLRRCPNASVVATSRIRLDAEGATWNLTPLALPPAGATLDEVAGSAAVSLFVERAKAASPSFKLTTANASDVADACRAVDGLPLAIELVAARANVLAPAQLATMVDERLSTVATDISREDPRHRTLEAAISWSWDLLSERERALLRRLSVFAGGATLVSAEAVCGGTALPRSDVGHHLERLVASSLVSHDGHRYRLLEPVRHYAHAQLVRAGESAEARTRHVRWAVALAEEAEPHLCGRGQHEWLRRLDADADNLRAAIGWCVRDQQADNGLRLAGALALWWRSTGSITDGRDAALAVLAIERPNLELDDGLAPRSKAMFTAALLADVCGDLEVASSLASEGLCLAERTDDLMLRARLLLVKANATQGANTSVEAMLRDCATLARQTNDHWCLAYALAIRGGVLSEQGRLRESLASIEESIGVARRAGDPLATGFGLCRLGNLLLRTGQLEEAALRLGEARSVLEGTSAPERAKILVDLGHVAVLQGDFVLATRQLELGLSEGERAGNLEVMAYALHELGTLTHLEGDAPGGRKLLESSMVTAAALGRTSSTTLEALARIATSEGNHAAARSLADDAYHVATSAGGPREVGRALVNCASSYRGSGDHDAARAALVAATKLFDEANDAGGIADVVEDLAGIAIMENHPRAAALLFGAAASVRADHCGLRATADQSLCDADLESARVALTPHDFEVLWTAGAGLSIDDVVALADQSFDRYRGDDGLTDKERAVANLAAQGLTNRQIAEHLYLSPRTVQWRLSIVFKKLGITSRAGLSRFAGSEDSRHSGDAPTAAGP